MRYHGPPVPVWKENARRTVHETRVFKVTERDMTEDDGEGRQGTFVAIEPPDWVNVVALTDARELVLIEQFRQGTGNVTLEIPGGMIDPDESPLMAARRELREETGFEADEWSELGMVHPNPAIQTNRTFTYLARAAVARASTAFDTHERCRLVTVPWAQALDLVSDGRITHSLVVCALHFAARRLPP
jgi:8-oxo-dGTP pyrophosphatase MutT (NUDIX family)